MVGRFHVVECEASGCLAEFFLNDVPLIRCGRGRGGNYAAPHHPLLRAGTNELTIVVEPGPTPGEALVGEGRARRWHVFEEEALARLSLARYPRGAVVGGPDRELVAEVVWRANPGRRRVPLVAGRTFEREEPGGAAWAWERCERIADLAGARQEVATLLGEWREALASGQLEPYLEANEPRFADLEAAYGHPPGTKAAQLKSANAQDRQTNGWRLEPLGQLDLRRCGGGRLLECVRPDGLPALREAKDEEGRFGSYPALVGRLEGRWRIVL
ncbi:MAG: hypothetical protein D6731_04770 [Planctomycetota bacterium]|nr:MAG: hypothetical protein D6731_04770 [Planctomycetota bacterium]